MVDCRLYSLADSSHDCIYGHPDLLLIPGVPCALTILVDFFCVILICCLSEQTLKGLTGLMDEVCDDDDGGGEGQECIGSKDSVTQKLLWVCSDTCLPMFSTNYVCPLPGHYVLFGVVYPKQSLFHLFAGFAGQFKFSKRRVRSAVDNDPSYILRIRCNLVAFISEL